MDKNDFFFFRNQMICDVIINCGFFNALNARFLKVMFCILNAEPRRSTMSFRLKDFFFRKFLIRLSRHTLGLILDIQLNKFIYNLKIWNKKWNEIHWEESPFLLKPLFSCPCFFSAFWRKFEDFWEIQLLFHTGDWNLN